MKRREIPLRVAEGLEAAPRAFLGMLEGRNSGKQIVKLV
jgi:NADPH-dependent curcumin reductase CurA